LFPLRRSGGEPFFYRFFLKSPLFLSGAAGFYANFFDAILDFGFWAFLTVAAILTGVRRVGVC